MPRIARWLSLIVGVLVVFTPLYILLVTAFKTKKELSSSFPYELPNSFLNMDNFTLVLEKGHVGLAFLNIIYIIALAVIGNMMIGTMAGYVLGRFNFRLKALILSAYVISIIIPNVTTQVATFGLIQSLGLFNTHYAMVVLNLGTDFIQIYIYIQFIRNIPYELDESAIVEGASLFRIYKSIIFPLLTPAIATVAILKIIGIYNDIYSPFLYMPSSKLAVISTILMRFTTNVAVDWNSVSAAIMIILIPTVTIFLFMQKYIISSIADGAVKG
ncbi:carbohydrate ABC transporter permease [Cohnella soli]|uniref:Carbohydrate ABC transporter permease n=1 Tax=Cohnella soli TaxID=425005 RepID=A0ABW0HX09_9BACL